MSDGILRMKREIRTLDELMKTDIRMPLTISIGSSDGVVRVTGVIAGNVNIAAVVKAIENSDRIQKEMIIKTKEAELEKLKKELND